MSRQSHGTTPTLCWVNLKQVFWPCQMFAFQFCFLMLVFVVGAIFSAQNDSITKQKLTRDQKTLSLVVWKLVVSCNHICHAPESNSPNLPTIHLIKPGLVTNDMSDLYLTLLFYKMFTNVKPKTWQSTKM